MARSQKLGLGKFKTVGFANFLGVLSIVLEAIAGVITIFSYIFYEAIKASIGSLNILSVSLIGISIFLVGILLFALGRLSMYVIRLMATWLLVFTSIGFLIYYAVTANPALVSPVYWTMSIFIFLMLIFYVSSFRVKWLMKLLEDHKLSIDRLEAGVGQVTSKLAPRETDQLGRLISGTKLTWGKIAKRVVGYLDLPEVFYESLIIALIAFAVVFISQSITPSLTMFVDVLLVLLFLTLILIIIDGTRIEKLRKDLVRAAA